MGDWTDLASKIIDHAAILGNNMAMDQGTYCSVIPKAAGSPSELRGWARSSDSGEPKLHYVDEVHQIPLIGGTLVNPNDLTFGVSWGYGGHWKGKGRYLRDAHAYCDVKNISVARNSMPACTGTKASTKATRTTRRPPCPAPSPCSGNSSG